MQRPTVLDLLAAEQVNRWGSLNCFITIIANDAVITCEFTVFMAHSWATKPCGLQSASFTNQQQTGEKSA